MKKTITKRVFNGRARDFSAMRVVVMQQLYPNGRFLTDGQSPNSVELMLNDFINSFSRYAGNQQTAFDNGVGRSAGIGSSSGSTLERRVERAITQVLGRAPGRGGDSFVNALADVFPTGSDGRQIIFTPSRS